MKLLVLFLFIGAVVSDLPGLNDENRHPSCTIVDFSQNENSEEYHVSYKCKAKDDKWKCSVITLDDCVSVKEDDGSLALRSGDIKKGYRSLTDNCYECSYYGYSMTLFCLCGKGRDPKVFNWDQIELGDVITNNDGILGNNDDSSKTCVAKEIECPKE